jgi:glutamate racemase
LVHHVEQGVTTGPEIEKELRHILKPIISAKCDVLALGCTHYPFLRKTIDKIIGPRVLFLDSGAAVARHAKRILTENKTLEPSPSKPSIPSLPSHDLFLTTGNPKTFVGALEQLLKIKRTVKLVRI